MRDELKMPKREFIKFIVVGEGGVGKTSFITRWTTGIFPDPNKLKSTIGASFSAKKITLLNNDEVLLQIWDFAGQLRFTRFMYELIRGAGAGFLFFDLSRISTLGTIVNFWIPKISTILNIDFEKDENHPFVLVGNKLDLVDDKRLGYIENSVIRVSRRYNLDYIFISAKEGTNIDKLEDMIRHIISTSNIIISKNNLLASESWS